LEEVVDPQPAPGQVLIAVKACSVNYPDVLVIEDKYQVKPQRPFAPGGEVSGVIEQLGAGVSGLSVGQRVLAQISSGGMAEKAVVAARDVTVIPDAMPFEDAASLLMTYATSLYALEHRTHIKPGEKLLVLGAGGGIGISAVQLGSALGAHVIAAASSQEKVDVAIAQGAHSGVVYPAGPFDKDGLKQLANLFKEACGTGWDIACDAVGGDYAEAAVRASGFNGRYLVVGFPAGIPKLPLNLVLLKSCDIIGVFWGGAFMREPDLKARITQRLLELYQAGKIKPLVSARFPLARGAEAIALLAERRAIGKIVVVID
jgi:NADPH2:quinone reductase